jgi:hypothetical protein
MRQLKSNAEPAISIPLLMTKDKEELFLAAPLPQCYSALDASVERQTNTKCLLSRSSFGTFQPFCDLSRLRLLSGEEL